MEPVLQTGVKCVGVIRAIMNTPDLRQASKRYVDAFKQYEKNE